MYRVLDLPPSMRPLVYDFGQLSSDTEAQYIHRIVETHWKDYCRQKEEQNDADTDEFEPELVRAVAAVLTWSQKYMRKRKVRYHWLILFLKEKRIHIVKTSFLSIIVVHDFTNIIHCIYV